MTDKTVTQRPGRVGISFAKVAEAAEALVVAGKKPTLRALRDSLGTGSMGTIQQHLAAWSAQQPQVPPVERELSANLKRALFAELAAHAEKATAELTDKLLLAEADRDAIAAEAIHTESTLAILQSSFAAEREMVSSLTSQVEALQSRLDTLQKQAERNATAEQEAKIAAAAAEARADAATAATTAATVREAAAQARIVELTDRLTKEMKHQ